MPIDLRDQYFGTEIEMTGITRQRAAQVVAEMFGTDYYHRICMTRGVCATNRERNGSSPVMEVSLRREK